MRRTAPRRSARTGRGQLGDAAQLIARRRRELGLTQRELSELAEVGERSVQSLEAGTARIRLDVVLRILDALGLALAVVPRSRGRALEAGGAALLAGTRETPGDR